jgi:hypothetical protein
MPSAAGSSFGTALPSLGPFASVLMQRRVRAQLFAAYMACGKHYFDGPSGVAYLDKDGVLLDDEGANSDFVRARNNPEPPRDIAEDYNTLQFDTLDYGKAVQILSDSDEFVVEERSGGETRVLQKYLARGMNRMMEGITRKVNTTLDAASTPFTGSQGNDVAVGGTKWDAASGTTIRSNFSTALDQLQRDAGAVYTTWKVIQILRTADELWADFGGTAGIGQLTYGQVFTAISNLCGCAPENIFITRNSLGMSAKLILFDRPQGMEPDPEVEACGMILGVDERNATVSAAMESEFPGRDPDAPSVRGLRITLEEVAHNLGFELYARLPTDFKVNPDGGVRITAIHS